MNKSEPIFPDSDANEDKYWRLLVAGPVDESLLLQVYIEQAQLDGMVQRPLSREERRLVIGSLQVNAAWQKAWHDLEEEFAIVAQWPQVNLPAVQGAPPSELRLVRGLRYAAAAALVAAAFYGLLWTSSKVTTPAAYEYAQLDPKIVEHAIGGTRVSTDELEAMPAIEKSLVALVNAETTYWGLFPRYEITFIAEAIAQLNIADAETDDPYQQSEITYFRLKAALMQNNTEEAQRQLEILMTNVIYWRNETYSADVSRIRQFLEH